MLRTNVIGHQLDGCGEKGRIIGEAQHRQKVRNGIDGKNEIGKGADSVAFTDVGVLRSKAQ